MYNLVFVMCRHLSRGMYKKVGIHMCYMFGLGIKRRMLDLGNREPQSTSRIVLRYWQCQTPIQGGKTSSSSCSAKYR